MSTDKKQRDTWDKLAVIASLLVPISVALVGTLGTQYLARQQAAQTAERDRLQGAETRDRLYVELQTSRERVESELRRSMFESVIRTFLRPESRDPPELVLALELLAYNFHEVIDLGPLFKHVETIVRAAPSPDTREQYARRLERAASEVIDKQLAALKDASAIFYDDVFFDELEKHPEGVRLFKSDEGNPDDKGIIELAKTHDSRTFAQVDILWHDPANKELRVRLWVYRVSAAEIAKGEVLAPVTEVDIVFKVGFFDFPMIDNTRLANGKRVALVMRSWDPGRADVALAYFPGSRASLKEKPYYEDLVEQLKRER